MRQPDDRSTINSCDDWKLIPSRRRGAAGLGGGGPAHTSAGAAAGRGAGGPLSPSYEPQRVTKVVTGRRPTQEARACAAQQAAWAPAAFLRGRRGTSPLILPEFTDCGRSGEQRAKGGILRRNHPAPFCPVANHQSPRVCAGPPPPKPAAGTTSEEGPEGDLSGIPKGRVFGA